MTMMMMMMMMMTRIVKKAHERANWSQIHSRAVTASTTFSGNTAVTAVSAADT